MNNVELIGRLTKDPELTYTAENQNARCRFAVAIDRQMKDGEKKADFPTVICFGKLAENCGQYLTIGRLVGVTGRIETAVYDKEDGSKQYSTYVVARSVEFLERAKQEGEFSPF